MNYTKDIIDFDIRMKLPVGYMYFLTRYFFGMRVIGGKTYQRIFTYLGIWLLLSISILLDSCFLLLKLTYEFLKVFILWSWRKFNDLIVGIFKWFGDVSKRFAVAALLWLLPFAVGFLLYSLFDSGKWRNLIDVFEDFWDLFL